MKQTRPIRRKPEILIELTDGWTQDIPSAVVATALRQVYGGRLVGFYAGEMHQNATHAGRAIELLKAHSGRHQKTLRSRYRAFGCLSFLFPSSRLRKKNFTAAEVAINRDQPITREEVENFKIHGIKIGDLIYDDYLAKAQIPTFNPRDAAFQEHLLNLSAFADLMVDYFKSRRVAAVIGPQVYRQGIIARIANSLGIPSFEADLGRIARSDQQIAPWSDFRGSRQLFLGLESGRQNEAIEKARNAVMQGPHRIDPTNHHLQFPGGREYPEFSVPKKRSDQKTVLLALHCLSDSPHVFGEWLYPDYGVWVSETIRVAHRAGHQVIIKPHPHCPDTSLVMPLIPPEAQDSVAFVAADISLDQVLANQVAAVITAFGNIGFEAALRGVQVVCAHPNNPFQDYSFAQSPDSRERYEEIIRCMRGKDVSDHSLELLEFYFMSRMYFPTNLFIENYEEALRDAGLSNDPRGRIRGSISRGWSATKERALLDRVVRFVESGANRLAPEDSFVPDSTKK